MLGRNQQRLVRVLAVQVDERAPALGELGRGREVTVDVAARAADRGNDAREHDFVVAVDEPALDARLVGAVAHQRRVGPASAQQVERVDDERLARAGLAGDHRHAVAERAAAGRR